MVRPARLRPVHRVCRLRVGTDLQMSVLLLALLAMQQLLQGLCTAVPVNSA